MTRSAVVAGRVGAGDNLLAQDSCSTLATMTAVRFAEAVVETRPHLALWQLASFAEEARRTGAVEAVDTLVAGAAVLTGCRRTGCRALGAARRTDAVKPADHVLAHGAAWTRIGAALVQVLKLLTC